LLRGTADRPGDEIETDDSRRYRRCEAGRRNIMLIDGA